MSFDRDADRHEHMTGLLTKIHVGIDAMTAAITSLHDTVRTHHDAQLERDRQMAAKADPPPRPVEKIDQPNIANQLRTERDRQMAGNAPPQTAEQPFAEKIAPSNIAEQIRSERAADLAKVAAAHEQDASEDVEEFTD